MDRSTLLITVFCLIDDWLAGQRVRQRGPAPILSDSEVLTVEVVGAFFGLATDEAIYSFFCQYYSDYFPRLSAVDRTTFIRQAANLWDAMCRYQSVRSLSNCNGDTPRCWQSRTAKVWLTTVRSQRHQRCHASRAQTRLIRYRSTSCPSTVSMRRRLPISQCGQRLRSRFLSLYGASRERPCAARSRIVPAFP